VKENAADGPSGGWLRFSFPEKTSEASGAAANLSSRGNG